MKAWELTITSGDTESGYTNIHDTKGDCDRTMVIEDDTGNIVTICNEEIGKLYDFIKHALAG